MNIHDKINANYPSLFGESVILPSPILDMKTKSVDITEILATLEIIINNKDDLPIYDKNGYLEDSWFCFHHTTPLVGDPIPYLMLSDGSGCYFLEIYRQITYVVETFSGIYNALETHETLKIKESLEKWRDFLIENGR